MGMFCFLTLSLSGGAFGPMYSHETARTVGNQRVELGGGFRNAGLAIEVNYGVTEKLDLGLHWESLSMGLKTKYVFLSEDRKGFSVSATGGFGQSFGGIYYLLAGNVSYLTGIIEPHFTLRGVLVTGNGTRSNPQTGSSLNLSALFSNYSYLEPIIGSRFWITPDHLFLSTEAGLIIPIGMLIVSGNIGYHF